MKRRTFLKLSSLTTFGLFIGSGLSASLLVISSFKTIQNPYTRLKSSLRFHFFQALFIFLPFIFLWLMKDDVKMETVIFLFLPLGILFVLVQIPIIQHTILRIALFLEKKTPLKYVHFLNDATAARILEKDGGQWRFRHQILQDYFSERYKN